VRSILHDPAAPDFGSILQDALSDKPGAIILMEPAGLAVAFLAEAEKQDLRDQTMWAGPTSLYLDTFPDTIGDYWWGHLTVQAELTTIDADTPDNQAWLATMDKYGSKDDPRDTFSQAGWLSAKIFTQTALEVGADNITRESMATALRAVKNYRSDLMCTPWYFGEGDRHNANHGGRVMIINADGAFEKVQDCEEVPDPELADVLALEKSAGLVG
jgi:branched-chain amino acid transport system substrate-binding protein